jgi:hypothetical protein
MPPSFTGRPWWCASDILRRVFAAHCAFTHALAAFLRRYARLVTRVARTGLGMRFTSRHGWPSSHSEFVATVQARNACWHAATGGTVCPHCPDRHPSSAGFSPVISSSIASRAFPGVAPIPMRLMDMPRLSILVRSYAAIASIPSFAVVRACPSFFSSLPPMSMMLLSPNRGFHGQCISPASVRE